MKRMKKKGTERRVYSAEFKAEAIVFNNLPNIIKTISDKFQLNG